MIFSGGNIYGKQLQLKAVGKVTYEESQVVFECSLYSATSVTIKLFCLRQPF